MKYDASTWSKLNLWRHASGELCVRPGLRRIYTPSSRSIVGGFSLSNAETGELWHYIWDVATSGTKDCRLRILDEDFQVFQIFIYGADVEPRGLSYARVQGQLLLGSPDLPTLWGWEGSGVRYAVKVDSDSGDTVINVPRGIITSWNNRAVVCNGSSMFVSDPVSVGGGDLRSFIGANQNQRPGAVYGVHEGAGGALVVVTSAGVYGLDSGASAVAVVGSNGSAWRVLSHAEAISYDSSCVVDGRVFALTKDGYMAVDVEDGEETSLTEPYMPRAYGPRVSLDDYRSASLLPGEHGPICAVEDQNVAHFHDNRSLISSWWRSSVTPTSFALRGLLKDTDGSDLLLCSNGVFRIDGDFDGEIALSSGVSTQPKGFLFSTTPSSPSANNLVRGIHVGADVGAGGSHFAAVRGRALPSSSGATGVSDQDGITIGTDAWGTSTKRYVTSSLQAVLFKSSEAAARPTDDVAIEVGASLCLTRIQPVVEVDVSESAALRPAKVT